MVRKVTAAMVALAVIGCTSNERADAQDTFYIANKTNRVELTPSRRTLAIRTERGRETAFEDFVNSLDGLDTLDLPELQERFGIVLVRGSDTSANFSPESTLERLRRSPAFESDTPVFESGAIELLFVGTYKVRFNPRASDADIQAVLDGIGAENVSNRDSNSGRYVIELPDAAFEEGLERINRLNSLDIVRYAQPDFVRVYPPRLTTPMAFRTFERTEEGRGFIAQSGRSSNCTPGGSLPTDLALPQDPMFENQWSLNNEGDNPLTGVPGADVGYIDALPDVSADDVRVAILDLGIDSEHDELVSAVVDQVDATDSGGPGLQHASNKHGTWVAGIVGADVGNEVGIAGVAKNVQLISVRIAKAVCETCGWVTLDGSEWRGIRKAADRDADVIVNSWAEAGGGFDSDIYAEIKDAIDAGSVMVFSAGNHFWEVEPDGSGNFNPVQGPSAVKFPASLAATAADESVRLGLIAVSATNQFDEFKTHEFEQELPIPSQDDETGWGSNRGPAVSLAAPGVHLYTTSVGNEYECFSGTSASAPLVGGAAAILKQQFPEATPAQIKHWLQAGADKLYLTGAGLDRDNYIGHGRLNIAGAIEVAAAETGQGPARPNPPGPIIPN